MHLAIFILLIWLAINIAFVVLRLRATGTDQRTPGSQKAVFNLHPRTAPLRHR